MEGDEFTRRMRVGDATVWEALMPKIRKIALGACHDLRMYDQVKEDIAQDVAIKVFTHWQNYEGSSKLGTWIYAIARNRCLDEIRRNAMRRTIDIKEVAGEEHDGTSILENQADSSQPGLLHRLCVQAVLAVLESQGQARKGSKRMIDVLRWWVENSPSAEELAQFLGTTPAAARERKSYIVKHLRELCLDHCGHEECAMEKESWAYATA